jgi:hypothetical protein
MQAVIVEKAGYASFRALFLEALEKIQSENGNSEGVYMMELLQAMDKGLSALANKGIPRTLADITFSKMAYADEVYFNPDYTQYSLVPLEGYVKWSDIMNSNVMAGFRFDKEKY